MTFARLIQLIFTYWDSNFRGFRLTLSDILRASDTYDLFFESFFDSRGFITNHELFNLVLARNLSKVFEIIPSVDSTQSPLARDIFNLFRNHKDRDLSILDVSHGPVWAASFMPYIGHKNISSDAYSEVVSSTYWRKPFVLCSSEELGACCLYVLCGLASFEDIRSCLMDDEWTSLRVENSIALHYLISRKDTIASHPFDGMPTEEDLRTARVITGNKMDAILSRKVLMSLIGNPFVRGYAQCVIDLYGKFSILFSNQAVERFRSIKQISIQSKLLTKSDWEEAKDHFL